MQLHGNDFILGHYQARVHAFHTPCPVPYRLLNFRFSFQTEKGKTFFFFFFLKPQEVIALLSVVKVVTPTNFGEHGGGFHTRYRILLECIKIEPAAVCKGTVCQPLQTLVWD